jgi:hypothetical protein
MPLYHWTSDALSGDREEGNIVIDADSPEHARQKVISHLLTNPVYTESDFGKVRFEAYMRDIAEQPEVIDIFLGFGAD